MDSNSGSLQSSSGDEEYDSRAADSSPFSAFMNNPSSTHLGAISNPLRPPSHHLHHNTNNNNQITSSMSMFDPSSLSGYNFDPLSSRSLPNQNPLLNLDMLIWSKTLRSDPNCTDPPNILPSSSPSPPIQTRFRTSSSSSPVVLVPPMPENVAVTVRPSSLASSEQTSTCSGSGTGTGTAGVRNSKKRSRASRRAPTTVLTTDTTNFRAMVQEFTGIPAPPFSTSSSPFPRTRFDLFSSHSSSTIHPPSSSQPPPPPYLLRPFAQKIQPPQPQPQPLPFVSSSTTNNNSTTSTTAISTNMTTTNSTSINYQLPVVNSDLVHQVNTMHNNINNPMLSFQSLLHTTPKYQLPNSTNNTLGSSRPPNDEFGLGNHGHVNPHLTASSRRGADISGNNSANWGGDGVGSNNNDVGDHQGFLLRSVNGNNYGNPQQQQQQRDTNGKGNNYMAASPSSNFNGDRGGGGGSENVSTRGEGMVESWLCSSD